MDMQHRLTDPQEQRDPRSGVELLPRCEAGDRNRAHFLGVAAREMRRSLVDHARRKAADKRGQHTQRLTLRPDHADASGADGMQIVELDLLLTALAKADPRKAKIAEFHYFGGLTQEETAEQLSVSPATVVRELRFLRRWIPTQLAAPSGSSS